ncbi:uncharacterized protein LOC106163421 [Lingula anatina]|uniref:chitin synthase n=1 Tax=Lingula anatina TaxID=7574 RepID=A0A2R2MTL1_LINAN|nr:uncharacterized protein LOC106163421 [Lingula anatina]|eukprot:XP_023933352.1 uncharacterized protein LOC106163421 [Lingula anatina]
MVLFLLKMADHTQAPEETVHSNDISAGNSAADGEDFSLTLNSSHEEEHPEVKDSTPYGCYFCLKVFASFLFATALLFALVANKVTIYAISHSLSNHSSGSGPNELTIDTIDQKISVFMLMVILIIPYGLAFLRCLWSSGVLQTLTRNLFCFCCCANFSCSRAKRDLETPWPSWGRIALIIVTSLLEVLGLWIILLYVFPFSTGLESVLSSALVFLGCNISDLLLWLKGRFFHDDQQIQEEPNARTKALTALFNTVPLFLSAIGLFLLLFFDKDIRHDGERGESSPIAWALPLGVALVAVSWVPTILQWQVTITPKKQLPISRIRFQLLAEDETGVSIFPDGCRWKAGLISNFLKVFFVPLVLLILGEIYIQNDAIINIALLIPPNEFATYVFHQEFFWYFLINIFSSLLGYLFAWATIAISFGFTCRFCKSKRIFISALFCPLITASPLAAILIGVERTCSVMLPPEQCHSQDELSWGFIATVLILVASFVSCGVWIVTTRPRTILTSESQIFWHANYTGALLEQWLWLNRKTEKKDLTPVPTDKEKKHCVIYLCTTMCNESEEEMTQLLLSLKNVIDGRDRGSPLFHSHIWLDGAFDTKTKPESNTLSRNALQLLGIVKSVFDVSLGNEPPGTVSYRFETRKTRYGRRFTWTFYDLNEELEDVDLNVHLKDNRKVKKKKRWSQIMYLSYIIDFLCIKTAKRTGLDVDEILKDTFILTTDADVKFEFASVEALLDVFLRDETKQLGAVCARTHPLGSVANPLVSYQIFDYAIGHWLQKVANHTLGSVLCAPGCFSMYRTAILKNVLPEYGSDTSCGTEFLYKDMGEDRWLCTLMVNNGAWLEYCAAAEDKTFCPTGFEEFFKQRRRWIVSTMANMFLLMRSFGTVVRCNKHITSLFMVYQFLLFISSLIGPATVILVIAGGYEYAYDINSVIITIILVILAAILLVVCYFAAHKTQILFAVGLSIILALAMVAGFIGTARQLVTDYNNITAFVYQVDKNDPWQVNVPISSIYITVVVGIFVITALLHPTEFLCLLHGITYLFFLPGGYLILMIYSICNITDQSWAEWVQMEVKEEVRKLVRAEASSSPNLDLESDDNMLGSSSSAVATSDHSEDRFWEQLVELRLKPQAVFPEREDRLAGELHDIRKTSLIWFAVANMFWLVLFLTLSNLPANDKKGSDLHVFGNNPVGLAFLFLFCLLLIIQFFSMLVHRVWTFIHLVARAKLPGSKTSRPDASVWNTRIARHQVADPEEEEQFYQSWNATLKRVTEFSQSMSDQRSLLGYSIRK